MESIDFPATDELTSCTIADYPSKNLLERLVQQELSERQASSALLPLTGGLDSRGLLGALLTILPPARIQTVTVGSHHHPDVIDAARLAERVGVRWERLDPHDVDWSPGSTQKVMDSASSRFPQNVAPVSFWIFFMSEMVKRWGGDGVVLVTGAGGGVSKGFRITTRDLEGSSRTSHQDFRVEAADRFLSSLVAASYRSCDCGANDAKRIHEYLKMWLGSLGDIGSTNVGVMYLDELNTHFRQRRLILPAFSGATDNWIAPYLNVEWRRACYNVPLQERFRGKFFTEMLFRDYPDIFEDLSPSRKPGNHSWRTLLRESVRILDRLAPGNDGIATKLRSLIQQRVMTRFGADLFAEIGDPREISGLKQFLQRGCQNFDDRHICKISATRDFQVLMSSPHYGAYVRSLSATMVDLQIRSGVFEEKDLH